MNVFCWQYRRSPFILRVMAVSIINHVSISSCQTRLSEMDSEITERSCRRHLAYCFQCSWTGVFVCVSVCVCPRVRVHMCVCPECENWLVFTCKHFLFYPICCIGVKYGQHHVPNKCRHYWFKQTGMWFCPYHGNCRERRVKASDW